MLEVSALSHHTASEEFILEYFLQISVAIVTNQIKRLQ